MLLAKILRSQRRHGVVEGIGCTWRSLMAPKVSPNISLTIQMTFMTSGENTKVASARSSDLPLLQDASWSTQVNVCLFDFVRLRLHAGEWPASCEGELTRADQHTV